MDNEKTITLDNVTMHRAVDGTVTIALKKGRGCVNTGLLIATTIITLLGGVMTVNGVIQFLKPEGRFDPGVAIFGLLITLMFGIYAFYLYLKVRFAQKKEPITITPISNVIKIGDSTIPFNDIADISVEEIPSVIEGAGVGIFRLALSNGKIVEIGRVTTEAQKLDQRKAEVIAFLKVALQKS
jgi:hypothetical protein